VRVIARAGRGRSPRPSTPRTALEDRTRPSAAYAAGIAGRAAEPERRGAVPHGHARRRTMPEISQAIYEGGPARQPPGGWQTSCPRRCRPGVWACPNPLEAVGVFGGMVVSTRQMAVMLGVPLALTDADFTRIADEAAARFPAGLRALNLPRPHPRGSP